MRPRVLAHLHRLGHYINFQPIVLDFRYLYCKNSSSLTRVLRLTNKLICTTPRQAARRFLLRSLACAVSRDDLSTNRPVTYLCSTLEISVW